MPRDTDSRSGGATFVATFLPLYKRDGSIRTFTLVDHDTYERAVREGHRYHWNAGDNPDLTGYPCRSTTRNGKYVSLRLHREILGLEPGDPREGDHINRNTLDNRRCNLRILPPGANEQNAKVRKGTSRYRGVSYWPRGEARGKPWKARVRVNGVLKELGYFAAEDEAGEAARKARAELLPYATD